MNLSFNPDTDYMLMPDVKGVCKIMCTITMQKKGESGMTASYKTTAQFVGAPGAVFVFLPHHNNVLQRQIYSFVISPFICHDLRVEHKA